MTTTAALLALFTHITILAVTTTLILILAGVGVLILLHVLIVGRAFSTAARTAASERLHTGSIGLLPDELAELPSTNLNSGESADCVVCLEGLQAGEGCRELPRCRHVFHVQCVDAWLMRAAVCPVCGTPVGGAGSSGKVVVRRVGLELEESRRMLIGFS